MVTDSLDNPHYYLDNFQTVLDWLSERYDDLLGSRERDFVETFSRVPQASRALLVRMIMRKGTTFRASKLCYAEIGSCREAIAPLVEAGWVDPRPELTLEALFGLLTKAEVTAVFRAHIPRPAARKAELLEMLQPLFDEPRCFDQWYEQSDDCVYALSIMALCDRFRLMFFGNLRQDWSEFVLADLGIYRYERVDLSPELRAFRCRADVDGYLHLHDCRERFEAGEPLADVLATIPDEIEDNAWLESHRAKLLFRIAQEAERHGDSVTALELYAECSYPGARMRRLRILERTQQYDIALVLAREAERSAESAAEAQHLERLLPRLHRKLGMEEPARRISTQVERIDLTLERPASFSSVEHAVLDTLSEPGGPVHYVENALINSLFGLLCWEAVFAPLPGAFFHPFHSGPADLLSPDFYRRRAARFDACLARLGSAEYRETIRANFRTKQGILSPFVQWGGLSEALLEQALSCLPPEHLRKWFERLLHDVQANRAGMPDLIQFWPEEKRYRMIEVKGPGDRLQDNQRRWLDFCAEHDMPVAVCHVQWTQAVAEEGQP